MITPADVELMKTLALVGIEVAKLIADLASGKKVSPKRVRAAWATVEQALAKRETDAAERERWPGEG